MDILLKVFEVVELAAIGGSLLAMAAFEISDALVDQQRLRLAVSRRVRAVVTGIKPATVKPVQVSVEFMPMAKAA